jgi:hypothetical protein
VTYANRLDANQVRNFLGDARSILSTVGLHDGRNVLFVATWQLSPDIQHKQQAKGGGTDGGHGHADSREEFAGFRAEVKGVLLVLEVPLSTKRACNFVCPTTRVYLHTGRPTWE